MSIASINPATGALIERFDALTDSEVDERLDLAVQTFASYRHTTFTERAELVSRLADILEERAEELGRLMTEEMGKPISAAVAEARKSAAACRYYAEYAEHILSDRVIETEAKLSPIRYLPRSEEH